MYDCLIIGGGILGLTMGRHFAIAGLKTAIVEANPGVGKENSFRNSAVVHAGIYYPSNSLKAKFCVRGKNLLRAYCEEKGIPYKALGKLIIARENSQLIKLKTLLEQGAQNGVHDLRLLNQQELNSLEPEVVGIGALFSPNTAIINGQLLMQSLKNDFIQAGGSLYTNTTVESCDVINKNYHISTNNPEFPVIHAKKLINSAGLGAQNIAKKITTLNPKTIPPLFYAKGNYYKYLEPSPFKRLIYPLPEAAGLGIHATLDLENNVRFGPDVEWVDRLDYKSSPSRKSLFVKEIRQYFPHLKEESLVPDDQYTGIRPKIKPISEQPQDFLIQTEADHGLKGLINLYGIESPGLTSAFAIAEEVFRSLEK